MNNTAAQAKTRRQWMIFTVIAVGAGFVFLLNIGLGSVRIPISSVCRVLLGLPVESETHVSIVMKIRLPRAIGAAAGGACLAVSGLLLQIFFNNPIVEPYVLGISSGSTLFVALVMLGGVSFGMRYMTPMNMFWGALVGALAVMMVIVLAARKVKSIVSLLVIGIMAGALCGAATSILSAMADRERVGTYMMWTMGSFAGVTWEQVRILAGVSSVFMLAAILMAKPLNALLLGEKYAQSMGVGIRAFRVLIVVIASVLTAVLTAFAGPIAFIGLAVPHIVRMSMGTSDNRVLMVSMVAAGALMSGLCDLGARLLLSPIELPIGALTSLIGAPLVVYLLLRKDNQL